MKQRYFCTLFEAVKLLLPVGMNLHLRIGYQCAHLSDAVPSPEEELVLEALMQANTPAHSGSASKKAPLAELGPRFFGKNGEARADSSL